MAVINRSRRHADHELPELLSDDALLAWGQSLVHAHHDASVEALRPDGSDDADGGGAAERDVLDDAAEALDGAGERPAEAAAGPGDVVDEAGDRAGRAEPVADARPARISLRRRELVALRRHLATQSVVRREPAGAGPTAATAAEAHRHEPLRGYRPTGRSPA